MSNKKNLAFLSVKSEAELKSTKLYTALEIKNINAFQPFVSDHVSTFNELEDNRNERTDIRIKMLNRLFLKGNYYVYIVANQRVDMVKNHFLIKIDKNGKPVGMIRSAPTL